MRTQEERNFRVTPEASNCGNASCKCENCNCGSECSGTNCGCGCKCCQ